MDNKMLLSTKVSVILPTYNRSNLIGKSIKSVLDQSYNDFELIIVDDASTDNTDEIVRAFNDPRIIYTTHSVNKGGAAARNTGINIARGEFIAFQDSDDLWLRNKLAKQVALLADSQPEIGVVYTRCSLLSGGQKKSIPCDSQVITEGNLYQALLQYNFITLPSALIKKTCLQKAGIFDEALPRFQDWELFLRIAKHFEFKYIPEPLLLAHVTEGSITSNPKAGINALEIILNKHFEEYRSDKSLYSKKLLDLADLYRLDNDIIKCREYLVKAFRVSHSPVLFLPILASFLGLDCFNFLLALTGRGERR
jgi:glycosyltransferase involved in cell wall biosynthesis